MKKIGIFSFSIDCGSLAIMIGRAKSFILILDWDGVERFSTLSPQRFVDYDSTGRCVKVVGVDEVE
jgi:hypothetical protein